ncbi:uncharacterized protein K452DRAFT_250060 [Aplosporella prunicola CBS 121167]|uniref:Fms interacting protein n=1 Tax=Aplosporella prunicola CBS 121167 TaxID=1176127 RepID=A0A6A6BFM5_9PEZI|nr:uncharacterized protein K452DRAFT_250060 [Aplosporella prunicola CBS 121167]KAF2142193.1 hypothetical protein K452DRAFT_250060 [Aplosporella prunicola CBS 121167]
MTSETIITDPSLLAVLEAADLARQQCDELLSLLAAHPRSKATDKLPSDVEAAVSTAQKTLHAHLAHVRNLNRKALHGVRATKAATADARHEVDTLHLQLQNLYYEERHLQGEIAACEAYDHPYQRLPLLPVDDFCAAFPDIANEVAGDEDALMVARIDHEHKERMALEEKRQGLLKRKQGLIAENKKRKEDLANLDKDLEKFIEAARPIEQTFQKEY